MEGIAKTMLPSTKKACQTHGKTGRKAQKMIPIVIIFILKNELFAWNVLQKRRFTM